MNRDGVCISSSDIIITMNICFLTPGSRPVNTIINIGCL